MNNDIIDSKIKNALETPDNIIRHNFQNESNHQESEGDYLMEILFKELKDDMRERDQRSERRFEEQQELLLSRIDKKLDEKFSSVDSNIKNIKDEIKEIKSGTTKWAIGIIVTIAVAIIGVLPQIINAITNLLEKMP